MDFLGIGPFEIVLIIILAFLFFGPEKLPGIAARAGRMYRNFRQATSDITKSISDEISTEQKAIAEDLTDGKTSLTEELSSLGKTVVEDISAESQAGDSKTAGTPQVDTSPNRKRATKTTPKPKSNEGIHG
jgi:sec-independent protein translocase protein TatB